jgi:hypothetical protein
VGKEQVRKLIEMTKSSGVNLRASGEIVKSISPGKPRGLRMSFVAPVE